MAQSRSKYLLKNTLIFTLGSFGTKCISFFLVPLYTNILTTSEYGVVDLISTVSAFAVPFLTLNIMDAVVRFNLDKGADRDEITKAGMMILLGTVIIGLAIIPVCDRIPILSGLGGFAYLYCVTMASCQVFLCDLRGKELLVQYSVGNIMQTFFIAVFNIIFLLGFKWSIKGYMAAFILSNFIVAIYALIIGKGYKAIFRKFNSCKAKEMLKYSIVLIPNSFMWWIMSSSDHLMVTSMVGIAANGIYSISYKLPTLISTLIGIFNQAWSYSAIKEEGSNDVENYSNLVFKSLTAVCFITGVGMMTFIKPFMKLYVSPEYYIAWRYTPYLIIGIVFNTLGTFMATSYVVHKDSKGIFLSGLFGACLNIILNCIFIPQIGVTGAALATCISYISVYVFRGMHTKKYLKYRIMSKETICGTVFMMVSAGLMFFDGVMAQTIQIIILAVTLITYKRYWFDVCVRIIKTFKSQVF